MKPLRSHKARVHFFGVSPLLDKGADVNMADQDGFKPLDVAVDKFPDFKNPTIALLIEHKAFIEKAFKTETEEKLKAISHPAILVDFYKKKYTKSLNGVVTSRDVQKLLVELNSDIKIAKEYSSTQAEATLQSLKVSAQERGLKLLNDEIRAKTKPPRIREEDKTAGLCVVCGDEVKLPEAIACGDPKCAAFALCSKGGCAQDFLSSRKSDPNPVACPNPGCNKLVEMSFIERANANLNIECQKSNLNNYIADITRQFAKINGVLAFICNTANCPGVHTFPKEDKESHSQMGCLHCGESCCGKCGKGHEGSCDSSKAEEHLTMVKQFLVEARKQGATMRPCPYCGKIVELTSGCNAVKCPECKKSFHWNYGLHEHYPHKEHQTRNGEVHDFAKEPMDERYYPEGDTDGMAKIHF